MARSSAYARSISPGFRHALMALTMQSVTVIKIIELKGHPCLTPASAQNANVRPQEPRVKWKLLPYSDCIALIICFGIPSLRITIHMNFLDTDGNADAKSTKNDKRSSRRTKRYLRGPRLNLNYALEHTTTTDKSTLHPESPFLQHKIKRHC